MKIYKIIKNNFLKLLSNLIADELFKIYWVVCRSTMPSDSIVLKTIQYYYCKCIKMVLRSTNSWLMMNGTKRTLTLPSQTWMLTAIFSIKLRQTLGRLLHLWGKDKDRLLFDHRDLWVELQWEMSRMHHQKISGQSDLRNQQFRNLMKHSQSIFMFDILFESWKAKILAPSNHTTLIWLMMPPQDILLKPFKHKVHPWRNKGLLSCKDLSKDYKLGWPD